jgi:serine phosphatase RsbU (regulator of sigma subunit)/tetratricopeptide (TPR) repeat protein
MRALLTYFIFLFSISLLAQQSRLDSLELILANTKAEKAQITLLNSLAFEYKGVDPFKTRELSERAYTLASKLNDKAGQATALHRKGLSYYYLDSYDTAMIYYNQSLAIASTTTDSTLSAQAYSAIGNVYRLQGINDTALVYLQKALRIYQRVDDSNNISACLSTIGDTYLFATEFEKALEYHQKALSMAKIQGDTYRQAFCLSSIGNNFHMRAKYQEAVNYHQQAIVLAESINEENLVAGSLASIADAYMQQSNFPMAIETYLKALDIAEKKGDKHNMAFIYAGIAEIYEKQKDVVKQEEYLNKSIDLSKEIGDYNRTCYTQLTMAQLKITLNDTSKAQDLVNQTLAMAAQYNYPYHAAWAWRVNGMISMKRGNFLLAEEQLRKSLAKCIEIEDYTSAAETGKHLSKALLASNKTKDAITEANLALDIAVKQEMLTLQFELSEILAEAYERDGNLNKALYYSKNARELTEKLRTEEITKKQTELFLQYQFDKEKESNRLNQELKDAEQQNRFRQQQFIIYGAAVLILLMLVLAFFIWRGYRLKQKANQIIVKQKQIVEQKNREITDSINYARNIQMAMLPTDDSISELFPEHFVLFRPRDIVSGDFYWIGEQKGLRFFSVADCTGHGVPGGFMSTLGITLLDEILNQKLILSPEKILDELRDQITLSLNRARKSGEAMARDGMDISIACLDTANRKLYFSGANNGLYIVNENGLTELRPDKQPVGAHETKTPFSLQTYSVKGGEKVIAFSDGYPDQFGGPKGKKLLYRRFKEMISTHAGKSMPELGQFLEAEFIKWQGNQEQIDDVCVFGIRIPNQ